MDGSEEIVLTIAELVELVFAMDSAQQYAIPYAEDFIAALVDGDEGVRRITKQMKVRVDHQRRIEQMAMQLYR